jgi:hypothetical protein
MARVTAPKKDSFEDFEIREDMRTLQRAREVMSDSKRMSRVKSMVKKETESLQSIEKGLRRMRGK